MLPLYYFYWFRIDNKYMTEPWLDQALMDLAYRSLRRGTSHQLYGKYGKYEKYGKIVVSLNFNHISLWLFSSEATHLTFREKPLKIFKFHKEDDWCQTLLMIDIWHAALYKIRVIWELKLRRNNWNRCGFMQIQNKHIFSCWSNLLFPSNS